MGIVECRVDLSFAVQGRRAADGRNVVLGEGTCVGGSDLRYTQEPLFQPSHHTDGSGQTIL